MRFRRRSNRSSALKRRTKEVDVSDMKNRLKQINKAYSLLGGVMYDLGDLDEGLQDDVADARKLIERAIKPLLREFR